MLTLVKIIVIGRRKWNWMNDNIINGVCDGYDHFHHHAETVLIFVSSSMLPKKKWFPIFHVDFWEFWFRFPDDSFNLISLKQTKNAIYFAGAIFWFFLCIANAICIHGCQCVCVLWGSSFVCLVIAICVTKKYMKCNNFLLWYIGRAE